MKTIEQHFCDWEANTFGYGYGSGEEHVLGALKTFLATMPEGKYDYRELEAGLTPAVTWLLINTLAHDDKIEYGTSPRFAWLTNGGKALAKFVGERSLDEVVGATERPQEYIHCFPGLL